MSPRIAVLSSFHEARAAWGALDGASCHPFQRWDWLSGWHRWIGESDGVKPAIVVVSADDGVPCMLWPLGIQRRGGVRQLVWMGGTISDYGAPVVSDSCPEDLLGNGFDALWAGILDALPPFDCVALERMPAELCGRPLPFPADQLSMNPSSCHQTRVGDDWAAYYRSKCSGKTRHTHRRKLRKLASHGEVRFEVATTADAVDRLLPDAFALKSAGYRDMGVTDIFEDERYRSFFGELAERLDGLVHLSGLWVGDELWATHLGLVHQGTLYVLFPGYRREDVSSRLSPGSALVSWLLQQACETPGIHTVDFTVGDEAYKGRWCEQVTPLQDLLLARSLRGVAVTNGIRLWLQAKRRIKAHPTVFPMLMKARSRLRGGS